MDYDKISDIAKGIYVGHIGFADCVILVDVKTLLFTKDTTFGNRMDDLIDFFRKIQTMNVETIYPADDMFGQFEQSRQVRKHMLLHPAKTSGACDTFGGRH